MNLKIFQSIKHYFKVRNKEKIHFLHIGKTGGTAVKEALRNRLITSKYFIILHSHSTTLYDIPIGEKVFFFLRDPITRYISGFYSRQRKGRPRYDNEWSKEEKIAFNNFDNPNTLAEALTSENAEYKANAEFAMRNIYHVKNSFWDWFGTEEYFLSRLEDVFYIGFQENLEKDFDTIITKLNIKKDVSLPVDRVKAHINPVNVDYTLSNLALKNLKKWYENDYKFISLCKKYFQHLFLDKY